MDDVSKILAQLSPLMSLMEALHARTCMRELWDALHTMYASTLDPNILTWLDFVTSLGTKVNLKIDDEIQKIVEGRSLPDSSSRDTLSKPPDRSRR